MISRVFEQYERNRINTHQHTSTRDLKKSVNNKKNTCDLEGGWPRTTGGLRCAFVPLWWLQLGGRTNSYLQPLRRANQSVVLFWGDSYTEIVLIVVKSGEPKLRLVVSPIIYKVLYIPGGCLGFLPSTISSKSPRFLLWHSIAFSIWKWKRSAWGYSVLDALAWMEMRSRFLLATKSGPRIWRYYMGVSRK